MGCVQSHQPDQGRGRRQADRRSPQHQHGQRPQSQHRHQQPVSNGHQRSQQRTNNRHQSPSPNKHIYENVSPNENNESQFHRQHFDRNSVLRHSKKRKKSSVTNLNSPTTINGESTENRAPKNNSPVGSSPNNNNSSPKSVNGELKQTRQSEDKEIRETICNIDNSASSKVAALLATDLPKPKQTSVPKNSPPRSSSAQEMALANGVKQKAVISEKTLSTSSGTLSSPTKMPKLSAGNGQGGNKKQPGSRSEHGRSNSAPGNRIVLRTRRQAAQEEEEQRGSNKETKSKPDESEDCGRLI